MIKMPLNKLKQSDQTYFKRKQDSKKVYVISHYNRSDKTFTCHNTEDINQEIFVKSNKEVFTDFDY